jgi:putative NADH-flavin reductase
MKVVIFGSTGGTGRNLVEQALSLGHIVTAFARIPASILIHDQRLTVLQGDVLDPAKVAPAIISQDAVLSALGSGLRAKNRVVSEGTKNILSTMKKFGVPRFVCESSFGVGDTYQDASMLSRFVFDTLLKKAFSDKEIQEEYIRRSDVEWIIVRPSGLTNGPRTGRYQVAEHMKLGVGARISRADVADFMLKQLNDDTWLRKSPVISY